MSDKLPNNKVIKDNFPNEFITFHKNPQKIPSFEFRELLDNFHYKFDLNNEYAISFLLPNNPLYINVFLDKVSRTSFEQGNLQRWWINNRYRFLKDDVDDIEELKDVINKEHIYDEYLFQRKKRLYDMIDWSRVSKDILFELVTSKNCDSFFRVLSNWIEDYQGKDYIPDDIHHFFSDILFRYKKGLFNFLALLIKPYWNQEKKKLLVAVCSVIIGALAIPVGQILMDVYSFLLDVIENDLYKIFIENFNGK